MTRVKICGITNVKDALAAVEYGADALGFICIRQSPRYVGEKEKLWSIANAMGPFVNRVGVCSNPVDLNEYSSVFDTAQFYEPQMDQNRAWYGEFTLVYAARMRDGSSLDQIERTLREDLSYVSGECPVDGLLLDAYHPDKLGGSGETFNWDLAISAKERIGLPIILAGGLTPENVGDAVRRVRPYAVDVSSGVEVSPGKKDHDKVRRFIEAVRAADEGE